MALSYTYMIYAIINSLKSVNKIDHIIISLQPFVHYSFSLGLDLSSLHFHPYLVL